MTGLLEVNREKLAQLCHRFGVARLEVFGSVARGEATDSSDLDLLHDLEPGRAIGWEIEDLTMELSRLFGRPVDLVSRAGLHPMLRDRVLAEAELMYAAA